MCVTREHGMWMWYVISVWYMHNTCVYDRCVRFAWCTACVYSVYHICILWFLCDAHIYMVCVMCVVWDFTCVTCLTYTHYLHVCCCVMCGCVTLQCAHLVCMCDTCMWYMWDPCVFLVCLYVHLLRGREQPSVLPPDTLSHSHTVTHHLCECQSCEHMGNPGQLFWIPTWVRAGPPSAVNDECVCFAQWYTVN